jgi:hypothetical protein
VNLPERPLQIFCPLLFYFVYLACMPACGRSFSPYIATRVGEASNPGPEDKPDVSLRFAITNPATITSKVSQYTKLFAEHQLDVISASETAATAIVQRQFAGSMRKSDIHTKWSTPLPDRTARSDGLPFFGGKASGVALMSKWRIRKVSDTTEPELLATSRLQHYLLQVGDFQLQIVVVYGVATPGADGVNRDLLTAALQAVEHFVIPYVIMGDFKSDPFRLVDVQLQDKRILDLKHFYFQKYGQVMPCTCKGSTWPGNALFSCQLVPWVSHVEVLPPEHFDAHRVVCFSLSIPSPDLTVYHIPLPKTWIDLNVDPTFLDAGYQRALQVLGTPVTLQDWGLTVECAMDFAYRQTQCVAFQLSWTQTKPLPKQYRGRCKPRKPEKKPRTLLTRPAKPGDYNPVGEITRRGTPGKIKQVRRVQALCRRVRTASQPNVNTKWHELQQEWHAILRSRSFGRCFIRWCQMTPELGPPSREVPTLAYLNTMLQILQHETNMEVAFDRQLHKDRLMFHNMLDQKYGGSSKAYATVRENQTHH